MARIRQLARDEAAPELQHYFDKNVEAYGKVLHSNGVYAYCPPIAQAYQGLNAAFPKSNQVTEELRRLVNLRVAQIVGCPS